MKKPETKAQVQGKLSIEAYLRHNTGPNNELIRETVLRQGGAVGLQSAEFWAKFIEQYI